MFSWWVGAFAELVSGGGGSSGLWDQMGGAETEITPAASSCIRVSVGQQLWGS